MLINLDVNAICNLVFTRVVSTYSAKSITLYLKKDDQAHDMETTA